MPSRAIVIGAGVSKSYDRSPTGVKMPISTDFFPTFNKLAISSNPFVRIGKVVNYFVRTRHQEPEAFVTFREDIEAFHSEIEAKLAEAISVRDRLEAVRLLSVSTQLVFVFVSVLNEIQNGPPSTLHERLVTRLTPDDVIITFNWDTLMDRALDEQTDWSPETGYLICPSAIYDGSWQKPKIVSRSESASPHILKLHGSTNWLTSYTVLNRDFQIDFTHDTRPDDFFVYRDTAEPYDCYDGRYMAGYQPYSYGYYPPNLPLPGKPAGEGRVILAVIPRGPFMPKGQFGKSGLVSLPLIIPPISNKRYDFFGGLFGTLWQTAEDRIAGADEIHVYGYSFPTTDTQSRDLFLKAFSRRSVPPRVLIVNPNYQSIVDRFVFEFGVPSRLVEVVPTYMDEKFEFDGLE